MFFFPLQQIHIALLWVTYVNMLKELLQTFLLLRQLVERRNHFFFFSNQFFVILLNFLDFLYYNFPTDFPILVLVVHRYFSHEPAGRSHWKSKFCFPFPCCPFGSQWIHTFIETLAMLTRNKFRVSGGSTRYMEGRSTRCMEGRSNPSGVTGQAKYQASLCHTKVELRWRLRTGPWRWPPWSFSGSCRTGEVDWFRCFSYILCSSHIRIVHNIIVDQFWLKFCCILGLMFSPLQGPAKFKLRAFERKS